MHFKSFCFATATLAITIMAAPIIEPSSLAAREAGVPRGFFNNNDAVSEEKRGFFNNNDVSGSSKEKRGFFNNNDAGSSEKRGFFNNNDVSDFSKAKRAFFNNGDSADASKSDEKVDDGYYYTYTDSNK
ncbi:hypothetical protein BPAE_0046g00420 [Botrytis paeoniae]|uniref:Uncharacterized protein n=1 Tax=Botrytis paeoniae TaxID=278948 RepID=A0A4Z1FWA8_9HELO|nr:hypothetical protein BPAE_0046g00420 [Botrytis paeoniae]